MGWTKTGSGLDLVGRLKKIQSQEKGVPPYISQGLCRLTHSNCASEGNLKSGIICKGLGKLTRRTEGWQHWKLLPFSNPRHELAREGVRIRPKEKSCTREGCPAEATALCDRVTCNLWWPGKEGDQDTVWPHIPSALWSTSHASHEPNTIGNHRAREHADVNHTSEPPRPGRREL